MKICKTCGRRKANKNFYVKKSARDGLWPHCKPCARDIASGRDPIDAAMTKAKAIRPHHTNLLLGNSREFLAMSSRPLV